MKKTNEKCILLHRLCPEAAGGKFSAQGGEQGGAAYDEYESNSHRGERKKRRGEREHKEKYQRGGETVAERRGGREGRQSREGESGGRRGKEQGDEGRSLRRRKQRAAWRVWAGPEGQRPPTCLHQRGRLSTSAHGQLQGHKDPCFPRKRVCSAYVCPWAPAAHWEEAGKGPAGPTG